MTTTIATPIDIPVATYSHAKAIEAVTREPILIFFSFLFFKDKIPRKIAKIPVKYRLIANFCFSYLRIST